MARIGVKPNQVLCVGDGVRDMEAAKEAALAFGGVAWGYTRVDVLAAQPDIELFYTVDDIARTVVQSG
jgi:phosphoglycolate phosphatase